VSPFHIGLDGGEWVIEDVAHTDGCRQVHHQVTLSDQGCHRAWIEDATLNELETRVIERPAQVLNPPSA
jgi:hypothetical protein